jgi:uncharacterized protein (DUF1015 family)
MAWVLPFRGILFDLTKVGDLTNVVAPPYDIISPTEQEALYQKHPYNVVRLILNRETPQDNPSDNRYTRSRSFYHSWCKEGVLVRAQRPSFYFLQEEFLLPDEGGGPSPRQIRRGFIGIVKLEDYERRIILPHEKTQDKPKADRLALMEACQANFCSIFSTYSDPDRAMDPIYEKVFSASPAAEFIGADGYRRKLWMVDEPEALKRITTILRPKPIFIADGHHRYETCLAYRRNQMARYPHHKGNETYHFTMMYLAGMEDPGLVILPTHRVVTDLQGFDPSSFLQKVSEIFHVDPFPFQPESEKAVRGHLLTTLSQKAGKARSLGMLLRGISSYFLLTLKTQSVFEEMIPPMHPSLQALDVNLLHVPIFQKLLGIGPSELAASKNVRYIKDPEEASEMIHSGKGQAAFFLNATTVYQVRDVSLAGETMPSKSTFFYPKVPSGLVINPLDPHEEIPGG